MTDRVRHRPRPTPCSTTWSTGGARCIAGPSWPSPSTSTTAMIRDHMATLGIAETLPHDRDRRHLHHGGRPARDAASSCGPTSTRLPVQEDEARAVHSEVEGVMHACGHDVHVASLLGAASLLAARREDLPGRYIFLFQPAEEALCGAKAMLEGGALDRHGGLAPGRVPRDLAAALGLRGPAGGHRHVRGQLAAHHPDRAGWARCHALGPGRRHPGHGGAGEPPG